MRGLKPLPSDPRDRKYRFTRRYGATALSNLPVEFSVDAGLTDPDQNRDGRPTECTAYSKTDLATDMTGKVYDPDYTYAMTLRVAGLPSDTEGADLRQSFKSVIAYGLLLKGDGPDLSHKSQAEAADYVRWLPYVERAQKNAQAAFRWIYDDIYDHFGDIQSGIYTFFTKTGLKQGVDWGIPWYPAFEQKDVVALADIEGQQPGSWHDVNIKGWKLKQAEPHLIIKPWEGKRRLYFSRDLVNYLYSVQGTGAAMYDPTGNRTWSLFGYLIEAFPSLLEIPNILSTLWKVAFTPASQDPVKQPETPQDAPKPVEPTVPTAPPAQSRLEAFCAAIQEHEGWYPGSRSFRNNNPGNCRYSSVGYAARYLPVLKDKDGFAIFKDYATGWLYLQNLVREKIQSNPNQTLAAFFELYAPTSDNNDPQAYAAAVGKRLGVNYQTFLIKNLL